MKFLKFFFCCFCFFPLSLLAEENPIYQVAVIGSGPAGLSAALVTAKEKASTVLFAGASLGGPLNAFTCMGNWPGSVKGKGKDVIARLFSQVEKAQVTIIKQSVVSCDFSKQPYRLYTDTGEEYHAHAVIIATGGIPNRLGVSGEEKYYRNIETSVYKSDAPRFENKRVAIVGGGIDAVKKTSIIAKSAQKVYLVVRGSSLQKQRWKKRLEKYGDKVEILYQSQVVNILGNEEKLTHLLIQSPNGEHSFELDTLILACGISPNSEWIKDQIDCDSQGYILLKDRTQKTSRSGVFAAGTITDARYRQAAISSGDGMKAGYDALEFILQFQKQ